MGKERHDIQRMAVVIALVDMVRPHKGKREREGMSFFFLTWSVKGGCVFEFAD